MRTRNSRPSLLNDVSGLSSVEYVILLMLVAVMAIPALRAFGRSVSARVAQASAAVGGL